MCHFPVTDHEHRSVSCRMEEQFGVDCWLHAKEAARLVEERRKDVNHKYHKKSSTLKLEEDYDQDGAQKEGGEGGGDIFSIELVFTPFICTLVKSVIEPDRPADVPNYTDCHVDPSELLAEPDT